MKQLDIGAQMDSARLDRHAPEFVFIFGAVGSGNTFMFNCLTQDENVYGVNEDKFGDTLYRILESEKEMGKCPHSLDAFIAFLHALRCDRRTLILKTPSNIRRVAVLRKYLPKSRCIMMIREPHAAITSGIARHASDFSIEKNARIWLNDCRRYADLDEESLIVTYEQLARDPTALMRRVSDRIMPLSEAVFAYARRMHRPERADPERWKTKVDSETADEIEHWVETLELEKHHRAVAAMAESNGQGLSSEQAAVPRPRFLRPLERAKKEFFRAWYRVRRG